MTPEEMRIAIAEKCGYKVVGYKQNGEPVFDDPDGIRSFGFEVGFPNYPYDLNAMHEAEKLLSANNAAVYANNLRRLLGFHQLTYFDLCHATALQRAEAFCRVFWPERFEK